VREGLPNDGATAKVNDARSGPGKAEANGVSGARRCSTPVPRRPIASGSF
jgi:hypothetical protein